MGTKRAAGRTPRGAGSSSSSDAGPDTPATGSPAIPAPLAARSSPPLRGGPGDGAGPRPSARNAPAPAQEETGSTSPEPGNVTTSTRSYRQQLVDASISLWRDSDRSAEAPQVSVRDGDSDSGLSKRRKLPTARSYFQRFKMVQDLIGASPDRVDKENISTRHVADTNISKQREGSSLIGKHRRHSSDDVCRVSKRRDSGLHEASEIRAERCSTPFPETGPVFSVPCTPTLTPSLQQLNDMQQTEDFVGTSPDRVDKENTSTRHLADTNISKQREGSSLIGKHKRHSSDDVCRVSKRCDSGLHEASEIRAERCSTPFPETGPMFSVPCTPTLTPSLQQLNDTQQTEDLVGASPDRVDKENTSTRRVADTNISKQCEGSSLIGKNKRHSSDAVCKVSKRRDYGLHEASKTRAEQCSTPFPETGPMFSVPCTPTLTPSLQQLNDTQQTEDLVGASPDRVDKENTSTRRVADTNISKQCEGSSLIGKNKRHSSDAVCKVSKRRDYGLHEASETRAEQCSTPFPETGPTFSVPCTPTLNPSLQQLNDTQQTEGVKELKNTPGNLHDQLEQELSILIKVLQLQDNVRLMAEQLFEYVLNNHQVVTEPVGILHAFNIALCWRAASLLNYKVDRRESLALVEKRLNCECNEDLVALMYRKLRTLKEKIPYREGETSIKGQPVSVEDIRLSRQDTSTNSENDHMFQNKEMDLHGKFTNGVSQEMSTVAEQMISERQEPVQETHRECHVQNDEMTRIIVEKSIDLVGNVFSLREKNILCKQQLEISGLVALRQNNVIRLKEVCSLVLEHIRRSHIDEMTRREKIKLTVQWFTMLMYAFLEHMKLQHDKLEELQSGTWSSERLLKKSLYKVARSGQLDLDFDQLITLPDSNFVVKEFIHFKERNGECRILETSVSYCQQLMRDEPAEVEDEPEADDQPEAEDEPDAVGEQNDEHRIVYFPEKLLSFWTSVRSGGGPASEALDFPENIISCSSDGIGVQSAGCSSSSIPSNDDSIGQEASTSECRNTEHISLVGAQSVLPCMSPQRSTDLSAQPNAAPSRCPPVEAEHTGLFDLATQAIHDLQPEMQPSILFSDAPLQKMPDDMSQTGVQPDRATGVPLGAAETSLHLGDSRLQGQGKSDGNVVVDPVLSEFPTYPADSPVTLQVSTEVETQTCESSMPAKQSASPPAQQSILGTEAASDLQPEVQPSTSMQDKPEEAVDEPDAVDEPAEAERAATLGAIAAQALQPEMQPSTSMQNEPEEAEDEPDAVDEPAEAERAATLCAIAAQAAMQPEMQSLASTQEVPFERSYHSGIPVLHSPTIHQSVEPSLDPHAGAEPVGMVAAHDLHSEILPSAPAPAEQNASLLAQQSLATSQHLPAEAEPADILGTEPACDLQPALGEVHDQPAEEQSCILGTIPLARAESTDTLCSLTAHVLQPEVQPSASMQDRPAEAEGAVMLGSTAAQDLQAELQSSTTVQHVPLERIRPEERRQIGFEPNMVPAGHEQPPTQRPPPVTRLVSNNPVLSDDCLKNELNTLMQCKSLCSKDYEHKKALLLMECNHEIEKIKEKYASLLEKEDSAYLQAERDLDDVCRKVAAHTSLAENFRVGMTPSAAAQGRSARPVMEQPSESSSAAETVAASPVTSSSAVRPPVRNPPGSHVRPLFVAQSSSSPSWNAQQQILIYGSSREQASSYGAKSAVPVVNTPYEKIPRVPSDKQLGQSHRPTNGTDQVSNSKQTSHTGLSPDPFDENGPHPKNKKPKPWSKEEDSNLTTGVQKYGEGNWLVIMHKYSFDNTRSAVQLSQRWALISKRQGTTKPANAKPVSAKFDKIKATQEAVSFALDGPMGKPGLSTFRRSGPSPQSIQHNAPAIGTTTPDFKSAANSSLLALPMPLQVQKPLPQGQRAPAQAAPLRVSNTLNKSRTNSKKQAAQANPAKAPSSIQAAAIAAGGRIAPQNVATKLLKAAQSTKAVRVRSRGTGSSKPSASSKPFSMDGDSGTQFGSAQHPELPNRSAPTSSPPVLTTQSTEQVNVVPEVAGVDPVEQSANAHLMEAERTLGTTPACHNMEIDDDSTYCAVTMEDLFPEDVKQPDIADPKDADIMLEFDRFVESQKKKPKQLLAVGKSATVFTRAPAAVKTTKTLGSHGATFPPAVTSSGLVGTGNAGVLSKALGWQLSGPGTTGKQNRCQEIVAQKQDTTNSKSNGMAKNAAPGPRTLAKNAGPSVGAPARNAASGAGATSRNAALGNAPPANSQYSPVVSGSSKVNPPARK